MNNITSTPSPIPPQIPPTGVTVPAMSPLGDDPQDREPLPNFVATIEAMLRQPRRVMYQLRQPALGRAGQNRRRIVIRCAALPAQPLHLHVPERLAGEDIKAEQAEQRSE